MVKRITMSVLFFAITSVAIGANFTDKTLFTAFEKWAKKQALPGYSFIQASKEGEAEFNETVVYNAEYRKNQKSGFKISFNAISDFSQYKMMAASKNETEFDLNGLKSVYFAMDAKHSYSMMCVQMPELFSSIVVMASPMLEKNAAIQLFRSFNFAELNSGSNSQQDQWPAEIPQQARMNAHLVKITKENASTDGFAYEYHVTFVMDAKLVSELQRIKSVYGGELVGMRIGDSFYFVCNQAESIDDLKQYTRTNDSVEFIYYKNQ